MISLDVIPSTTSVLSAYTTFAASAVLVRTVLNEFKSVANQLMPKWLQDKVLSKLGSLSGNLSSQMSLTIDEYNGLIINEMFGASEVYLRANISPSVHKLMVSKSAKENDLCISMCKGETILDVFEGIHLVWKFCCSESQRPNDEYEDRFTTETVEKRSFQLVFNKQHKDKVLNAYLPRVLERSKAIKEETKVIKLYSSGNGVQGVNLEHPSTFSTLAMDPEVKKALVDDLDRFVRRRAFYKRVGKTWKRGYLLYGPPGTGKSSLVAAMANYLKFDIYDLELSSLRSNSEFRRLLATTKNRSILVIEDIDCSIELQNREAGMPNTNSGRQLTLSGLLNFIDGLWSSCGDERIIVFTTNYKEKLDPALLRPGRMDMHIHMSYCTPGGFKILASNYLGLQSHNKFSEIEKLITEVEVTPAEIAEELMKSEVVDAALEALVDFLNRKKQGKVESNIKEEDQGKVEEKAQEVETKVGSKKRPRTSMRRRRQKSRI